MMLALGVVEPGHSGLGGGGFMVYHDAKTGKITSYDAREAAPAAADGRWLYGTDGKPMPLRHAVAGGRSLGAPGSLQPMEAVHGARTLHAMFNGAAHNPSKRPTGDLAAYHVRERPPICGAYRSYRICGMGTPATGVPVVLMILKQLERFDIKKLGKDSPVAWH